MSKKSITRLQEMLAKVDDPNIKTIIDGVFKIELKFRSDAKLNVPRQKLRDEVDNVARLIEFKENSKDL